jgi:hypothetical protein
VAVGFWILGSFRCLGRERRRENCTAAGKKWGRGKKCDLKTSHARPKTEYVRTYISTFDRTRAGAVHGCKGESCFRKYISKFERLRAGKCV